MHTTWTQLAARAVALCGLHLCGPAPADALTILDDGAPHVVFDATWQNDTIEVRDSTAGATTTLFVNDGALIGSNAAEEELDSVRAIASSGGHAVVRQSGGRLLDKLSVLDDSCALITGGQIDGDVTDVAILADAATGLARVDIDDGTILTSVEARRGARVFIDGGSLGRDLQGVSVRGEALARNASVSITETTTAGSVRAGEHTTVTITDGSFGQDVYGLSTFVSGPASWARVNVLNGVFTGGISVLAGGRLDVAAGSFGASGQIGVSLTVRSQGALARADFAGASVTQSARVGDNAQLTVHSGSIGSGFGGGSLMVFGSAAQAVAYVKGGTLSSSATASAGGHVRILGGSIGSGGAIDPHSVEASGSNSHAEIYGGAVGGPIYAGQGGIIDVYGTGLQLVGGSLVGTLSDGTPINVAATTLGTGQIVLHDPYQLIEIPAGDIPVAVEGGTRIRFPAFVLPLPFDCDGALDTYPFVHLEGVSLDLPGSGSGGEAHALIRRLEDARNPGDFPFTSAIAVELTALQLRTAEPVELASGTTETLYLTLQSARGAHPLDPPPGPASSGGMTIDFALQTFDTALELFYDVRQGALDGPIVYSASDTLVSEAELPWTLLQGRAGSRAAPEPGPDDFLPGLAGTPYAFDLLGGAWSLHVSSPRAAVIPPVPVLSGAAPLLAAVLMAAGALATRRRWRA